MYVCDTPAGRLAVLRVLPVPVLERLSLTSNRERLELRTARGTVEHAALHARFSAFARPHVGGRLERRRLSPWRVAPVDGGADQAPRTVELRHHTVTGTRVVFVDNQAIETTLGSSTIFSALFSAESDRVQFPCRTAASRTCGDQAQRPHGVFLHALRSRRASAGGDGDAEASTGPPPFTYKVSVPEAVRGKDAMFEPVVWFRVDVERTTAATGAVCKSTVHRRFRDFVELADDLRSSFKGHHLLGNVPDPPPKELKALQDHFEPSFVEDRRRALESMVQRIAAVPRFCSCASVQAFVGLSEQVREASVLFGDGPLGIIVDPSPSKSGRSSSSMVVGFKPLDDGRQGPALESGVVQIGDIMSKINGDSVAELSHEQVMMRLRGARPMMVHFLGFYQSEVHSGAGPGMPQRPEP